MSLLWCRKEQVIHPFYIEILGIHIYSSQELCYVIYHNPLLVLDGFADQALLSFIGTELDLKPLEEKLRKMIREGCREEELLLQILSECDYYTPQEVNQFKQSVAALKKQHPAVYLKSVADYLFQKKQYGKAAARYERLLEYPRDKTVTDEFFSRVYHNLGAAMVQMFQFEKAARFLDQSYQLNRSETTLKELYFLTVFSPELVLPEHDQEMFSPELTAQWQGELEQSRQAALAAPEVVKLRELFKKDPVKRAEGAGALIARWKQEYRMMI